MNLTHLQGSRLAQYFEGVLAKIISLYLFI